VIIPIGRRRGNLAELYADYKAGLLATGLAFEIIFIVDGPLDTVQQELQSLLAAGESFVVLELARRFGESASVTVGLDYARGGTIVTLPAYAQIDAGDIGKLVAGLEHADVAIAVRTPRAGGAFERMRRRVFHSILANVTGRSYQDLGCNARALRRLVLEEIHVYGDQLRFLPILAGRQGFRVQEVQVAQSPLDRRQYSYGATDYVRGALDIFTVYFLVKFTKTPLRFFGSIGALAFIFGSASLLWIVIDRLFFGEPLSDRPALVLSTLLIVLGVLLFALGLLCELVIFTHARHINDYQVKLVARREGTDAGMIERVVND
jgi:glycosyltransferase involved in cell wall biosynthesis